MLFTVKLGFAYHFVNPYFIQAYSLSTIAWTNMEFFFHWQVAKCVEVGIPALLIILLFSQVTSLRL